MDDDDANLTCMGITQTVCTLLEGATSTPALFATIEPRCYQLLDAIFRPESIDFVQDGLEILSYLTFYGPDPLSVGLWKYFALLHQSVCGGSLPGFELTGEDASGWAIDYLEEMLNPLDNYISRGTEIFLTQTGPAGKPFTEMLYEMISKGISSDNEETQIGAARIAACIFESCPAGRVDAQVLPYLQITWPQFDDSEKTDVGRWIMYLYGAMLLYDAVLVGKATAHLGITDAFFSKYSKNPKFVKNPDEKKVMMLAICQMIRRIESLPPCLVPLLPALVQTLAVTSKSIVEIRAKIQEALKEDEVDSDEDSDDASEGSFDLQDLNEHEDADQTHQVDMYRRLREQLAKYKNESGEEDGDEEDDSSLFSIDDSERTTPLDNIDEFGLIMDTLSNSSPQLQQQVVGWLGMDNLVAWRSFLEQNRGKQQTNK